MIVILRDEQHQRRLWEMARGKPTRADVSHVNAGVPEADDRSRVRGRSVMSPDILALGGGVPFGRRY